MTADAEVVGNELRPEGNRDPYGVTEAIETPRGVLRLAGGGR